ncbi:DUF6516 family protein [Microseira sp. BLCC-F43]|uniref:toxin-antitoxin system TumE family protein n=1 Tax=Microseira sp. BLCC-F43 TaxID=3153602 RepID=UPI0035B82E61
MLIEEYFQLLQEVIEACTVVQSFNLIPEKRGDSEGFIRGVINLTDGSILYLREFVNVEISINREMYSYQYMDASKSLIFRYDNLEHHKKLNLPNYPHHKHDGSEDNVISSNAPMLAEVLNEIATLLG